MAGLVCAARARELGLRPRLIEKGRRPGGSMLLSSGVVWRHLEWAQFRAECLDLVIVERRLDLAVGKDALLDLEAQRALDQRLVLAEKQIVGVRAIDAANLVDIAESLRRQQCASRTGAL